MKTVIDEIRKIKSNNLTPIIIMGKNAMRDFCRKIDQPDGSIITNFSGCEVIINEEYPDKLEVVCKEQYR